MTTEKTRNRACERNKDAKCGCADYDAWPPNPKKPECKQTFYASGKSFVDGSWQSCGWQIEASSFAEAAAIAEADPTFKLHTLSDNAAY